MNFEGLYYRNNLKVGEPIELELDAQGFLLKTKSGEVIRWYLDTIVAHPENDQHKAYFSNKSFNPVQHIEIQGQGFVDVIHHKYHALLDSKPVHSNRMLFIKWSSFLLVLLAILLFLWLIILPKLADRMARTLPYSTEQKIGEVAWNQIKQSQTIDTLKSKLANEFFHELEWDKKYPTHVFVVNEKIINAFALPGGNIVIYSGLLDKMKSYQELAALLGHEYGHIEQRHMARGMAQSLSTFALLGILLGGTGGIVAVLAEQSNNLFNLKYSRSYETESDDFSLIKLQEANIDPQGILELFKRLQEDNPEKQEAIPDFLSTHPGISIRMDRIRDKINTLKLNLEQHPNLEKLFSDLKS